EELVAGAQAGPRPGGPGQHGELLAEEQVLGDEVASAAQQRTEQVDEEEQVLEHGPHMMPGSCRNWSARDFRPHRPFATPSPYSSGSSVWTPGAPTGTSANRSGGRLVRSRGQGAWSLPTVRTSPRANPCHSPSVSAW